MSVENPSTAVARGKARKPNKPYPEFPLYAHATKRWAKRILGAIHYFGPWDDPDGALAKYLKEKDALHAGRKPREASEGVTVKELCNRFLNAKQTDVDFRAHSCRGWATKTTVNPAAQARREVRRRETRSSRSRVRRSRRRT